MSYRRTIAVLSAVLLVPSAAALASPATAGTDASTGISVAATPTPAFAGDAPDPDVVLAGTTYYAFSTGTSLASYLQVLCNGTGSPASGWAPCEGFPFGASALPSPPSWQALGTQNSPGVFQWNGAWIMFYTAALAGHRGDTGANCLSVAVDAALTPTTPWFTDTSKSPLVCDAASGGAIDPMPFVDPADNQPYLLWKTNSGVPGHPAELWSQPLGSDGMTLVGQPHLLQVQDPVDHPYESTIENPQMVASGGAYYLVFSAGQWDSAGYGEVAVACAGPNGPCEGPAGGPFLSSYGSVAGPGAGMFFQDSVGHWRMAYAAWDASCTDYSCGGARRLFVAPASIEPLPLAPPVTGIASTPDGGGYWLVDARGGVSAHGTALFNGGMLGLHLNAPVEHLVPTPDGHGYWLVASDGGIFTFGNARFFGSMGGRQLNAPVVDLAPTPDGGGYWLVASDGGVFAFGDAVFRGSMGGLPLRDPVVGIAPDGATGGYWLVASDGGIFAYGAPFAGSTGALTLNRPVNGMAATADGRGYWFVASDGGVFAFGDAGFRGSAGAIPLAAPVTGMASDPATGGYWLVGSDGGVFSYSAPFLGTG
jgi:Glycosyl hydrolases family 43